MKRGRADPDVDEAMDLLKRLQADLEAAHQRNQQRMEELRRSLPDE